MLNKDLSWIPARTSVALQNANVESEDDSSEKNITDCIKDSMVEVHKSMAAIQARIDDLEATLHSKD